MINRRRFRSPGQRGVVLIVTLGSQSRTGDDIVVRTDHLQEFETELETASGCIDAELSLSDTCGHDRNEVQKVYQRGEPCDVAVNESGDTWMSESENNGSVL